MATDPGREIKFEIGHVLFIDIVGYSKLFINEQSAQIQTLNEIVRETEQFRIAAGEGKLVRLPTGDGSALVFRTTPEAPVLCAAEIGRELKRHPELRVRMGIHSGPVNEVTDLNEHSNIAGAGINIAQRIMDCGDAGHILVSQRVADDLEQYPRWRPLLHHLGECEVKHGVRVQAVNLYTDEFGNPASPEKFKRASVAAGARRTAVGRTRMSPIVIATLIIAASTLGGFLLWQQQKSKVLGTPIAAITEKSIAVLPFENLSRDPDNAYFADGIQDEILTRLSKIADLKVISRTSTQHYKSAPENLPEIGRLLGVAHILEGSVQKAGNAVRVNVQLIKAATDSHLWADTFDRKLIDIFSVESEVSKTIADQLRAKLTGLEEQVMVAKPTDNVEAHDAYLRGLAYILKTGSGANSVSAQKYLTEAVRLDPKFALAWALLSYVDSRGYNDGTLQPTVALREKAREAADMALTLQPNLGEAILAKGYYYYALTDYDNAGHYFEQARQFLPNNSRIPESLAYVTRKRGKWDISESLFNEAERLDPRNVYLLGQHAQSYILLRRFPEALRKLDQVLNITPDDVEIVAFKAAIAQAEGNLPRAAALLAPFRPGADLAGPLETQVYQAILERHPAQMIPRLKEILINPDRALGFYTGELRFWLGWAQKVAGDPVGAEESWKQARNELEPFFKEQPENFQLIGDLALTNMGLGDKATALALADRATNMLPIEKDAVYGPFPTEILARVCAQAEERDRAIAAIQKLLSTPYGGPMGPPLTPALLRLDPMFDPLRGDPRFQKLCQAK